MITDKILSNSLLPRNPPTLNLHALSPKHKPHCKNKQTKNLAKQNKMTKKTPSSSSYHFHWGEKEKGILICQLSFLSIHTSDDSHFVILIDSNTGWE